MRNLKYFILNYIKAIKKLLQTVSSLNDKFEILIDADKTNSIMREARLFKSQLNESMKILRENLISIEKVFFGFSQDL